MKHATTVLKGVVALVHCPSDGVVQSKDVLSQKLQRLGARVLSRISRSVTHIVVHQSPSVSKEVDDAEVTDLYERAGKVKSPAIVIRALWVDQCLTGQVHIEEDEYIIPPPRRALLNKTPKSAPGKRKRKSLAPKPLEAYEIDVNDPFFSSTQLLNDPPPPTIQGTTVGRGTKRKRQAPPQAAAQLPYLPPPTPKQGLACGEDTQLAADTLEVLRLDLGFVDAPPEESPPPKRQRGQEGRKRPTQQAPEPPRTRAYGGTATNASPLRSPGLDQVPQAGPTTQVMSVPKHPKRPRTLRRRQGCFEPANPPPDLPVPTSAAPAAQDAQASRASGEETGAKPMDGPQCGAGALAPGSVEIGSAAKGPLPHTEQPPEGNRGGRQRRRRTEELSSAKPSPVDKPLARKGRRQTEGAAQRVQQESGQVQTRRLRRKTTGEGAVPVKDLVGPKSQAARRRTKVIAADQSEESPAIRATLVSPNSGHADQSLAAAVPEQATCLSEIIMVPREPEQRVQPLAGISEAVTTRSAIPVPGNSAAAVASEVAQPSVVPSKFVVPDWMLAGPAASTASGLPMCPEPGLAPDQICSPPSDQICPPPCSQGDTQGAVSEGAHELADTAATPAAKEKAAMSTEGALRDAVQPNLRPIPVPRFTRVETPVVRPALCRSRGPPQPLQAKSMNIPNDTPVVVPVTKEASSSLAKWSAPRVWDPPKARVAEELDTVGMAPADIRPPPKAWAAAGHDTVETSAPDVCPQSKACADQKQGICDARAPGKPPRGAHTIKPGAIARVGCPEGQILSPGPQGNEARKEKPGIVAVKGCLALSSVEKETIALAKLATKKLRGIRLCADGGEESVTHLVLGKDRRTFKVLMAVAKGAYLVTPAWLTASHAAGEWVDPAGYAPTRFSNAAARARELRERGERLLEGIKLHIHVAARPPNGVQSKLKETRKLLEALGAKVVGPATCSTAIFFLGEGCPPGLPATTPLVKVEWLYNAVEDYRLPPADHEWSIAKKGCVVENKPGK